MKNFGSCRMLNDFEHFFNSRICRCFQSKCWSQFGCIRFFSRFYIGKGTLRTTSSAFVVILISDHVGSGCFGGFDIGVDVIQNGFDMGSIEFTEKCAYEFRDPKKMVDTWNEQGRNEREL